LKTQGAVAADVTWAQVHQFRLTRHHLVSSSPKKDLVQVIGHIGGLQAQVMSAAEMQAVVRVRCKVEDVRTALWKDKTLVKTWLMRATLHVVPSQDLPIYAAAMNEYGIRNTNAWLKFMQITEAELTDLIGGIGEALDGQALTRDQLIAKVGKGRSERIQQAMRSGWGGVLKPVARRGLLCFGPSRGQNVTFVRPEKWLGTWREVDPDAALSELARRYLHAYGPATKKDFTRWWGSWSGVGNKAWGGLGDELVPVSVEGQRADILAADLEGLSSARHQQSLCLLPSFDPYLMGHASREHLVAAAHRSRVSRTAGWISAVVLSDGRVVATWTHRVQKGTLVVNVDPLIKMAPATTKEVKAHAAALAEALGLDGAQVTLA
jgi:hypothetical protein